MGVSRPPDSPEAVLLARIQTLFAQLSEIDSRTYEYERLSAEIHELSMAYGKLVDAKQGRDRSDPKA